MTATLKAFGKPGTPEFKDDNVARVLREIIVDFLLKLKDKHPFSNPKEMNVMDVYTKTMDIISEYIMKPSKILLSAYSKSEVTKKLNTLPSYQHLYDLFQRGVEEENDPSLQMKKKTYEFMMNRFNSRSPFIFYFNPNFEVTETYGYMWFGIGFYSNCSVIIYFALLNLKTSYHSSKLNKFRIDFLNYDLLIINGLLHTKKCLL